MFKKSRSETKSDAKTKSTSKAEPEPEPENEPLKSLLQCSSDAQRLKYTQSIDLIAEKELKRIKKEIAKQIKDWVHRPDEPSIFRYSYLYYNNDGSLLDDLALGDLRSSLSHKVDTWLQEEGVKGKSKWTLRVHLSADIDIQWPPPAPLEPPAYTA